MDIDYSIPVVKWDKYKLSDYIDISRDEIISFPRYVAGVGNPLSMTDDEITVIFDVYICYLSQFNQINSNLIVKDIIDRYCISDEKDIEIVDSHYEFYITEVKENKVPYDSLLELEKLLG